MLRGRRVMLIIPFDSIENPPLGIFYLAAAAREAGHEVSVFVCRSAEFGPALKKELRLFNPDAVGMSSNLISADSCHAAAAVVKSFNPAVHFVLGGPQATTSPEICLSGRDIDSVVIGEGEMTFCELLGALADERRMRLVRGLVWKNRAGRVIRNAPRPRIKDLDSLPVPAWDLYPRDLWSGDGTRKMSFSINGSRGCPFSCTFCVSRAMWGRNVREHSPQRIVSEMNLVYERYGFERFAFCDSNFTLRRDHVIEVCRQIRENGKGNFTWLCQTRVDLVDLKLLRIMKGSGCRIVAYGVESGSQRILDRIKKRIKLEQCLSAAEMTRKAGISVAAAFMLGFPTETEAETKKTVEFILRMKPDGLSLTIAIPLLGSGMFLDAMRNGRLRKGCVMSDLARSDRVWIPGGRTRKDLERWMDTALKKVNRVLHLDYRKKPGYAYAFPKSTGPRFPTRAGERLHAQ